MRQHLNKFKKLLNTSQGFTLIEILVALALISVVLGLALRNPFSTSRADLDNDSAQIERAVRFISDEAALRNAVVRIHFFLDKDPQEYSVEYGPSDSFILTSKPEFETTVESKEDEEKKKKETKNLNMKFTRVAEFQEKNIELSNNIKIIGVATPQSEKLQTAGEVSLYSYPTGEKDEALVLIASDEDIISLRVKPFTSKIDRSVQPIGKAEGNEKELEVVLEKRAKEIFEKWKREK